MQSRKFKSKSGVNRQRKTLSFLYVIHLVRIEAEEVRIEAASGIHDFKGAASGENITGKHLKGRS